MGLFDFFRPKNKAVTVSGYKMVEDRGDSFFAWNGKLYQSDIVRAAIRPKARAMGKSVGKHLRETINADGTRELKVNPEPYMRFLLEEPNPYMTGQMLQEKLAVQLELNNNAFAFIDRDTSGYPTGIYPINSSYVEALKDKGGRLYLKFTLAGSGKFVTFYYTDIIHLRKDFNSGEIFGDPTAPALKQLMDVVTTTDQGIVKAIKNSNVIRWLLKYNQTLRPEDLKKQTKQFVEDYLSVESETVGAAATDAKAEAIQVSPKDYVPNAVQMDKTTQRVYSFFNTNADIVQGDYTEDQWVAYYSQSVEPDILQLSGEYTRKLFTRRERGFGNRVVFESSSFAFASMKTKLELVQFVDRGILNPNEVRAILNWAPREGGDAYVLRKDTGVVGEENEED